MVGENPGLADAAVRELRQRRQRALFERWQRLHTQKNNTVSVVLRDTISEKMRELEEEMEALDETA